MVTPATPLRISLLIRQFRPHPTSRRLLSTSAPRPFPEYASTSHPLLTTPTCPPSGCACAPTPSDLAIDRERQLNGTMPPYAQHVVIRTGRDDWSSRIEDEPATLGAETGGGNFARALKGLVGRGGKFHDPTRPILITNSNTLRHNSIDKRTHPNTRFHAVQIYPQNIFLPRIPNTPEGYETFVRSFLVSHEEKTRMFETKKALKRGDGFDEEGFPRTKGAEEKHIQYHQLPSPSILICGHNSRDTRCGVMGPLLQDEFKKHVFRENRWKSLQRGEWSLKADRRGLLHKQVELPYASIALISHIGGHAFAGNVVIYFPKRWKPAGKGEVSPLAGKGVWYGRVEPKHVWGIMEETLKSGRIIEDLLRGVQVPSDRDTIQDLVLDRVAGRKGFVNG